MGLVSLGQSSSVRGVITILEENKRHPVLSRRKRDPHAWGGGARDAVAGPRAEEAQRAPGEQCDPGALPAESDQRPPGRRVGRHRKPASPADGHTPLGTREVRCAARTVSAARFCGLRCAHDAARSSGRGQRFLPPPLPRQKCVPGKQCPAPQPRSPPSAFRVCTFADPKRFPSRGLARHLSRRARLAVSASRIRGTSELWRASGRHSFYGRMSLSGVYAVTCASCPFTMSPHPGRVSCPAHTDRGRPGAAAQLGTRFSPSAELTFRGGHA